MTSELPRDRARTRSRRRISPQLVGLLAAAAAVFVTCCGVAAGTPPLATADETAHLLCGWLLLETAHPGGRTASQVPWALVLLVPVALAVLLAVQVAAAVAADRADHP